MKPKLLPEIAQHAPQLLAGEGIERGERLVQHQQRRLMDQRAAERDTLLHAAGQLPRIAVAKTLQSDGRKQLLGLRAKLGLPRAKLRAVRLHDLERQQHVVDDLAPRQQVRVLERHAGDLHRALHLCAGDRHRPRGRPMQTGDEPHQGRLAAAGRADHRGEFAAPDLQRDVLRARATSPERAAIVQRHPIDVDERLQRLLPIDADLDQNFRSAAGGRYSDVKMSAGFGLAFLNS